MTDAQGGSGDGVGIRKLLPCLEDEQFGSVAGLHVVHSGSTVLEPPWSDTVVAPGRRCAPKTSAFGHPKLAQIVSMYHSGLPKSRDRFAGKLPIPNLGSRRNLVCPDNRWHPWDSTASRD